MIASGSYLRYHIHLVLLSLSYLQLWQILFPPFLITVTVLKRAPLGCYHCSKMPETNHEEQKGLHCITVWSSHSRMESSHHFRFLTRVGHCRRAGHSPPDSGSKGKMRATVLQRLFLGRSPKVPKALMRFYLQKGPPSPSREVRGWAKLNTDSLGNTYPNIERSTQVFVKSFN